MPPPPQVDGLINKESGSRTNQAIKNNRNSPGPPARTGGGGRARVVWGFSDILNISDVYVILVFYLLTTVTVVGAARFLFCLLHPLPRGFIY